MKSIWIAALIVVTVAGGGLYLGRQSSQESAYIPSILRVGILPDQNGERTRARFSPLLDYLAEETGFRVELVVASDYQHLLELFKNRQVDMARFGGLGFVQAATFYDASPLVMRDVDTRFTSWFMVRNDSPAQNIADLQGGRFSFGSRLSTSGHLMPRYFMQTNYQIEPEAFFTDVRYSGAHDETLYSLLRGEVDLGVVNPFIVKAMIMDGRLSPDALRLLWETPPYPDYVWTVHDSLDGQIKTELRNSFLALDPINIEHKAVLNKLQGSGFLPAGSHDFEQLKEIASSLGLLTLSPR